VCVFVCVYVFILFVFRYLYMVPVLFSLHTNTSSCLSSLYFTLSVTHILTHNTHTHTHRYIPVLMAQAKIYWDLGNYEMVEKIFKQSLEFTSEHHVWKLNVAHVFFMQVCVCVCVWCACVCVCVCVCVMCGVGFVFFLVVF